MSDSVASAAYASQNTPGVNVSVSTQFAHENRTLCATTHDGFIQDVEISVCAKVNTCWFRSMGNPWAMPKMSVHNLCERNHTKPYVISRQMVWYILRHHPFSQGQYSTPRLGNMYGRDHTTVISGLRKMSDHLERGLPIGVKLQEVCDELSIRYGVYRPLQVQPSKAYQKLHRLSKPKGVVPGSIQRDVDAQRARRNREIFKLHSDGETIADLSRRFSLNKCWVAKIIAKQRGCT